ncbi:MAG: GIY-YIG nuclease family protein [Candidatus Peribacteraceae bacterium]|nr:GIY-YIG nuclease family protein [Candidatus Peribacteraceae bacterium]
MFKVYVLTNKKGKIYIGQTRDLEKRLFEHNSSGSGYTSKFRPWKLAYFEEFPSRSEAMPRERFLKTGKGREEISTKIGSVG